MAFTLEQAATKLREDSAQPSQQPSPQAPIQPESVAPQTTPRRYSLEEASKVVKGEEVPMEQGESQPGFFGNVNRFLDEGDMEVQKSIDLVGSGEISMFEGIVQILGKGFAVPALETIGEAANTVIKAVFDQLHPKAQEDLRNAGKAIVDSDLGRQGIAAAMKGAEEYAKWKEGNPRFARNLESAVDIGMLFAPGTHKAFKSGRGPVNTYPSALEKTEQKLRSAAALQEKKARKDWLLDRVREAPTPKSKAGFAMRTEVTGGKFEQRTIKPTKMEEAMAESLGKVPGVKQTNTYHRNIDLALDQSLELQKGIEQIYTASTKQLPVDLVETRIRYDVGKTLDDLVTLRSEKYQRDVTEGMLERARKILDKHPETPEGLYLSRRDFDVYLEKLQASVWKNEGQSNVVKEVGRAIRDSMNSILDNAVPDGQQLRRHQFNLLLASENMSRKAAGEYANEILNAWGRIAEHAGFRGRFMQNAALLFGTTTYAASAMVAPFLTAGATGIALTVAGKKILGSATTKRGLANLLKGADEAIKTVTDPKTLTQLKVDRAMLYDIYQRFEVQEEGQESQ